MTGVRRTRPLLRDIGRLAVGTTALFATLAGCSSSDSTASSLAPEPAAATAQSGHDVADVDFARQMIPHHRQAVVMAELAVDPKSAASAPVREFADRIKTAQEPEIALMSQWLQDWNVTQPSSPAGTAEMGTMDHAPGSEPAALMPGMMSGTEMAELSRSTGPAFDQRWLTMMIRHHEGAVAMAQIELRDGSYSDAVHLAGQIITAQQTEIEQMQKILGG